MTFAGMWLGKLGSISRLYHYFSSGKGCLAELMNIMTISAPGKGLMLCLLEVGAFFQVRVNY